MVSTSALFIFFLLQEMNWFEKLQKKKKKKLFFSQELDILHQLVAYLWVQELWDRWEEGGGDLVLVQTDLRRLLVATQDLQNLGHQGGRLVGHWA